MAAKIGDQMAVKHGAAGAEKRITTGESFIGLAAETERSITAEMQTLGVDSIIERSAIRLQTVADLYYAAILGAKDLPALDVLVKRYGWVAASALRAMALVRETKKDAGRVNPLDVLAAVKEQADNGNE